jgi:hypothetical protein
MNIEYTKQQSTSTSDGIKQTKAKEQRQNKLERRHEAERERWLSRSNTLPKRIPARGYELTSSQFDFDILDLSTLATLHIGRAVRGALSRNP